MDQGLKLLLQVLDGDASEEQLRQFVETLREDPIARRDVVSQSLMDVQLSKLLAEADTAEIAENVTGDPVTKRSGHQRMRTWSLSAALVALLLVTAGVGVWWISQPPVIARIAHVSNVPEKEAVEVGLAIRQGSTVSIPSGVIEIVTDRDVTLVMEGPCECRFETAQRVHLIKGRLYADVAEEGHGFTVIAPGGNIVDFGTRFGVEVSANGVTEVHVFEGLVTAETLDGGNAKKVEVAGGKAVALDARTKTIVDVPLQEKFATTTQPFIEGFGHRTGTLAGKRGWIDSGLHEELVATGGKGLGYPGLARGDIGSLRINDWNRLTSPVDRRWHHRYFSVIVRLRDGFVVSAEDENADAVLLSFAATANGPSAQPIRLSARAIDKQNIEFCVRDEDRRACAESNAQGKIHFVVIEFSSGNLHLWIDPEPESLGAKIFPQPDAKLSIGTSAVPQWLRLGDVNNSRFVRFDVDELRGGSSWAEVTPRKP